MITKKQLKKLNEDQAKQIEEMRALITELLPYLRDYVGYGMGLGTGPEEHESDECADCQWYGKALWWQDRFDSGEIARISGIQQGLEL